ncbi:MAG TPA: hypothetical protein VJ953_12115, partial [Saprospiraceae bacterium]|nr:hypothetical protein [Saprospiraceae bacterium]
TSTTVNWVSRHVLTALTLAKINGYADKLKLPTAENYNLKMDQLEADSLNVSIIDHLEILAALGIKVDYSWFLNSLDQQHDLSLPQQLRLVRLRQQTGGTVDLSFLETYRQHNILGQAFVTTADSLDGRLLPQTTNLQTNLLAFEVLSQDSSQYEFARSVLDYLLRQSRLGNTYDQARLVFLAVPFLRKHKEKIDPGKVKIGQLELDSLPYMVFWPQDSTLTLTKEGNGLIYLSATQSYSELDPKPRDSIFAIHTEFFSFGDTLEAGKPVRFQVSLKVKKEADYVQLTVPIPAGCSYDQKSGFDDPAVHTEFHREKVVSFFKKLPVGDYTFQINLVPRYTGRYQVNPATAKLMYFPVINGNNGAGTISIQ